jgi:hypothetical protein
MVGWRPLTPVRAATTVEEVYANGGEDAFSLLIGPDVLRGNHLSAETCVTLDLFLQPRDEILATYV